MDLRTQLLDTADRYAARTGRSKARLATIVMNDGKFFKRVEAGGGFTVRTYDRFMRFFAESAATSAPTQRDIEAAIAEADEAAA